MKFTVETCFFFGYVLLSVVVLLEGRYLDERDWLSNVMDSLSRPMDGLEGQGTRNVDSREFDGSNESEHESDFPAHSLNPVQVNKRQIGFGGMLCCNRPPPTKSSHTKRDNSAEAYLVKNQLLTALFKDILDSTQYKELNYDKVQRSPADVLPWQSSASFDGDNLYKRGVKRDEQPPLQSEVHTVKLTSRTG